MTKSQLVEHLLKLSDGCRRRTVTNKRLDAQYRARGRQLAYRQAARLVAQLSERTLTHARSLPQDW